MKIPLKVESFWLEKLLYPTFLLLPQGTIKPYTQFTLAEMKYKQKAEILLSPDQLDKLLVNIQLILARHPEKPLYSRFDSFFFIMQILGIKVSTSLDDEWTDLWERFTNQNSAFNWEYIEDINNGELLVNLGFGIHPPEDSESAGFWDLNALGLGFSYRGYTSAVTHTINTVSAIGAIHAEMNSSQKKHSHITYQLTYNLHMKSLGAIGQEPKVNSSLCRLHMMSTSTTWRMSRKSLTHMTGTWTDPTESGMSTIAELRASIDCFCI